MNKTTFTKPDMIADELVMPQPRIKVERLSVKHMLKFDQYTLNSIQDTVARLRGRPMHDINPMPQGRGHA